MKIDELPKISSRQEKITWSNNNWSSFILSKDENSPIISNSIASYNMNEYDEAILFILAEYLFCPKWLFLYWLNQTKYLRMDNSENILNTWSMLGLLWCEDTAIGEFIRPTRNLLNMFEKNDKYFEIPFTQLQHTIAEQQITYDILTGNKNNNIVHNFSDIFIPKMSYLGIKSEIGTNIISEKHFKGIFSYKSMSYDEINDFENDLKEQIKNKNKITSELKDFSKFMIVKKVNNTNNISKDFLFHIPDLIIPIFRDNGKAQSIAIEVELSNKGLFRYIKTLQMYKNNNRYGYIIWLCNDQSIIKNLQKAFEKVDCQNMFISNFNYIKGERK